MNRKKAMCPNCLNRHKALRVRFGDQEDRTPFLSPKRHLRTGLIYLQLKATRPSIAQVQYCRGAYGGSLIEVDGKGLVSPDRCLGVYEHDFPKV